MPAILVVDDDPDTCQNMSDLLGDLGYRVDAVEQGTNALEKARRQPYDLALLDFRMPGMDGLTLCGHLKRIQPRLVPMIISGCAQSIPRREALHAGVKHILPKPIDWPALISLLEEAVNERES